MRMPFAYRSIRGQTTLEYLLLLAVVAVIVISSFGPGSLISKVHDSAQDYYNSVTRVIMGENPKSINGGWCPVTCPSSGSSGPAVMYAACECPAPAFGGKYCNTPKGNIAANGEVNCATQGGVVPCGPCPTGQVCNSSGKCGCSDGLTCNGTNGSPPNSSPDATCSKCNCDQGSYWNGTSCAYCSQPCTTYNGNGACVPVVCGSNMTCNPALPVCQECACNAGTIYTGSSSTLCTTSGGGCVACPSCETPSANGKSCVSNAATACASLPNTWCNPALPSSQECACDESPGWNPTWNGNGCSVGGTCTPGTCPSGNVCGPDTCGNANGCKGSNACHAGYSCDLGYGSSTYGKCVCTPNCNGKNCGSDGCGGSCGTCVDSGICASGTCACKPNCSTTGAKCGYDGCGGSCGICASPQTCNASGQCV